MQSRLQAALCGFDESQFTQEVVIPLIEILHPGKVEYTHGTIEAGRDVISYGRDQLGRPHILCAQIKSQKLSYGAPDFDRFVSAAKGARREGVTLENGQKAFPHEVWMISSFPFPDPARRQVADSLQELEKNSIKLITGEELCRLVLDKMPTLASQLSNYSDPKIADLISYLSKHHEGRAFGLAYDRNIDEFYVSATLAPTAELTYLALSGILTLQDSMIPFSIPITPALLKLVQKSGTRSGRAALNRFVVSEIVDPSFVKDFRVAVHVRYDGGLQLQKMYYGLADNLDGSVLFKLKRRFDIELRALTRIVSRCPKALEDSAESVIKLCVAFDKLERFLTTALGFGKVRPLY